MEHVRNLFKDSENLDVIVKGTVTGKSMNSQDEVLYQIGTPCGDCFEADERCEYDGSEWWEFKTIPTEKDKVEQIYHLGNGMWDTIKELNEDKL